jgi:hypothetical protein
MLSWSKTEYMKCDFSATTQEEGDVRLDGQVVPKKDTFRYLGSKRMGISMKMLVIELKPAGSSGVKLLASCVTLECHLS